MVVALRYNMPDLPLFPRLDAVPRAPALIDTGVHMVETQPRHEAEFPGAAGIYGAVSAMGFDGL